MYHNGYLEAKHATRDLRAWHTGEPHMSDVFVRYLLESKFTPCGTSGDQRFGFNDNEFLNKTRHSCGFVSGKMCYKDNLVRRWTCCPDIRISGTMQDAMNIPGCKNIQDTKVALPKPLYWVPMKPPMKIPMKIEK